jgi:hypothetical protein
VAEEPRLSRIVRLRRLPEYTGLGMTVIKQAIRRGEFTCISLTPSGRAKGVLEADLIAWQQGRKAAAAVKVSEKPSQAEPPKPKIKRRHLKPPAKPRVTRTGASQKRKR